MPMHHGHVLVPVCVISILWNVHTNPYHPSETTSWNNRVTVPVKPQERQITSCRARGGQHARLSHKHCKPCAKHAHAPLPRGRIRLHVCIVSIMWNSALPAVFVEYKIQELTPQGEGKKMCNLLLCVTYSRDYRYLFLFSIYPTTPLPAPQRFQFIHQFRSLKTFTMNDRLQLFNFGIFIS